MGRFDCTCSEVSERMRRFRFRNLCISQKVSDYEIIAVALRNQLRPLTEEKENGDILREVWRR